MSDLAVTHSMGEPKSAWEYHTEYVIYRIEHKLFFCPYCGVELDDKCIYKGEGERYHKR